MKNITIYDYDAEKINELADKNDISIAGIVAELMEFLPEAIEANGWETDNKT